MKLFTKLISLLIIFSFTLSLFSCKPLQNPDDDGDNNARTTVTREEWVKAFAEDNYTTKETFYLGSGVSLIYTVKRCNDLVCYCEVETVVDDNQTSSTNAVASTRPQVSSSNGTDVSIDTPPEQDSELGMPDSSFDTSTYDFELDSYNASVDISEVSEETIVDEITYALDTAATTASPSFNDIDISFTYPSYIKNYVDSNGNKYTIEYHPNVVVLDHSHFCCSKTHNGTAYKIIKVKDEQGNEVEKWIVYNPLSTITSVPEYDSYTYDAKEKAYVSYDIENNCKNFVFFKNGNFVKNVLIDASFSGFDLTDVPSNATSTSDYQVYFHERYNIGKTTVDHTFSLDDVVTQVFND